MDSSASSYRLLAVAFVLLMNAFFAAAEVSLVSARPSRLKQLAAEGNVGARAALSLLATPERLLSVVQVGVTLASLGLGWAGENLVFGALTAALGPLIPEGFTAALHTVSFGAAFVVIAYAHVVFGEVIPKNLALERAEALSVLIAPALLVFSRAVSPFVYVIERSAKASSRVLGLKAEPLGGGHSAEELKLIISASRLHGRLESFEEAAIRRLLDMQDYLVREIMVPRSEITSVNVNADLDEVLTVMHQHQFSRLPVYEGEPEKVIGVVHYKDVADVWWERRAAAGERRRAPQFGLRFLMRKPFVVPETKPVNQLVDDFRGEHSHMAIVVDEFGTVVGLVTLEDVLEQIFGEIEDEHDAHLPPLVSHAPELELDGRINIRDLETQYGIVLPVDAGFETLAGFLLDRLGYIPQGGETVDYDGLRFTVVAMDRNRIARVKIERPEVPLEGDAIALDDKP